MARLEFIIISLLLFSCKKPNYEERIKLINANPIVELIGTDSIFKFDFKLLEGVQFPEFSLKDINENTYTNEYFKNKKTIIVFWFLGCPPCIEEIPHLNEFYSTFCNDKLPLISATFNDKKLILEDNKTREIKYPIIASAEIFLNNTLHYNFGYPLFFFIDEKGNIEKVFRCQTEGRNMIFEILKILK